MERWLLISNCQTHSMVQCLHLLNSQLTVDGIDLGMYARDAASISASMKNYTRVILHPEAVHVPGFDASLAPDITFLPGISFEAYHPDNCYAEAAGTRILGPLADYQSHLAIAGYVAGLSLDDTLRMFCGEVYEQCGYLDLWAPERSRLLSAFHACDLDIEDLFLRWVGREPFMYSINHPRIAATNDLARRLLQTVGLDAVGSYVLPPDNLALPACWPVYPEIGEAIGLEGSYSFKVHDQFRHLSLREFVEASFAAYASFEPSTVSVAAYYRPQFDRVLSVVRSRA